MARPKALLFPLGKSGKKVAAVLSSALRQLPGYSLSQPPAATPHPHTVRVPHHLLFIIAHLVFY
jgi:hypothetical protein